MNDVSRWKKRQPIGPVLSLLVIPQSTSAFQSLTFRFSDKATEVSLGIFAMKWQTDLLEDRYGINLYSIVELLLVVLILL